MIAAFLVIALLGVVGLVALDLAEPLPRPPLPGDRYRLPRGVGTVLRVEGGEILMRVAEGDCVLALTRIPEASWAEVAEDWIPLDPDPDLLIPPPAGGGR